MKTKKLLSALLASVLVLSSASVMAEEQKGDLLIMPAPQKAITVEYNDDALEFDVEPVIEDGRTLVPFRAIFEAMGCSVDYYKDENGKQTVFANRANDSLSMSIGEAKMYFNSEEILLDVPAKIIDSRTLVPIRAISEAFESEVLWDGETKTVSIYPPAGFFKVRAEKLSKTITDDDGSVLIEAEAYYPVVEYSDEYPYISEMNEEFKWVAEQFMMAADDTREYAQTIKGFMDVTPYQPLEYSMTFEEDYNAFGIITVTTHGYVNLAGAHPQTLINSRTFNVGAEEEYSLSDFIDELALEDVSLSEYVYNAFAEKLAEMGYEPDENGVYTELEDMIGSVQYYPTKNSLILYMNQGDIAPYAFGVISVEIPYEPMLFGIDLSNMDLEEYVYQVESYEGYKWVFAGCTEETLDCAETYEEYSDEERLSEYYPIGITTITAKGIKKGNAEFKVARVEDGKDIESAEEVRTIVIYVDEDNRVNVVNEIIEEKGE